MRGWHVTATKEFLSRGEVHMAHAQALSYDDAIKDIVEGHRDTDQPPHAIILFRDPEEQVIRLLDVTDLVPETGEVYRIRFGRTPEIPYVSELAQVTPSEWPKIRAGEIELPEGWDLNSCEEV